MRIIIDIPKEFEEHFKQDNFEDTLHRLCADAHLIAGNYEKETAVMLIQAFKESIPVDRIVEQLEKKKNEYLEGFRTHNDDEMYGVACGFGDSIEIVRRGGV